MGRTTYITTATGKNVEDIFGELQNDASFEYGQNPSNGTISTTSLGGEVTMTKKMIADRKKDNYWAESDEYCEQMFPEKRLTLYTKEISHYEAFTPKFIAQKELVSRKKGVRILPRFSVILGMTNYNYGRNVERAVSFDTLTEAKREAKAVALSTGKDVEIKQQRSGGERAIRLGTMRLETDGKQYKSQRTSKAKVYLPVYKFTFFVHAAT